MTIRKPSALARESPPEPVTPRTERRILMWLFVIAAATFLIFQEGAITGYDGGTMYEVTKSMVEQGDVAISDEWNTLPGRDGRQYGRYGIGLSLFSAIPYMAAWPLAQFSGDSDQVLEAAVSSAMPLITALLVVALYLLGRQMGARIGASILVAVGAVAGTFVLPYSKEFFAEQLAALFTVVAFERLLVGRAVASGLALGAATLTRPQQALLAPVLVLVAWRRGGISEAIRAMAGIAPGVLITLLYNHLRFGQPFSFGYEDVGFTTPFMDGATGLLFNPLKSIFLFAPIIIVIPFAIRHLWQRDRTAFALITSNLAITFVLTATWFAWHGGWSWGPRLLLPGLVPTIATIGPWLTTRNRARVTALLFAFGFAVSFPALIVSTQTQQLEVPRVPPEAHFLDTQPLSSPSVPRQWELILPTASYSIEHAYEGRDDGQNYLRYLSLWQFGAMRVFGHSGLLVAVAGTVMLLVAIAFSLQKLRAAVHDGSVADAVGAVPSTHVLGGARARAT
jgi:hypothetical protein